MTNLVAARSRITKMIRTYADFAPEYLRNAAAMHLAVGVGFGVLAAFLLWPITGGDYPPGVDTPAFLHLSWVADLAFTGNLPDRLEDPFWYGGFNYLVYPPLSYGLVGLITAITPASLAHVYASVLILAYGAFGFSTWFLAREFGLRWWPAGLAGVFTLLAYSSLNSVFLWGWFTTVVSLPFALLSVAFLERSFQRRSKRAALAAGVLMALATLAHHMTGLSIVMGLTLWMAFRLFRERDSRREMFVSCLIAAVATLILILPWAIPFLITTADTGFRREIPGNWLVPLGTYTTNILDPGLVGEFVYPSYLGIVLTAFALLGAFLSFVEGNRLASVTSILAVLLWFSLGANANPLINHYPLSGLDVARFHIFMTPFMALLAASAVERSIAALAQASRRLQSPSSWGVALAVAISVVLAYPVYTALQARNLAEPYRVETQVRQALDWIEDNSPNDGSTPSSVYAVGFWNWQAFLVPALTGQRIVDGWHDEGADNVRSIRQLRNMAWPPGGPVDAEKVHEILSDLDGRFVLLYRAYWQGERVDEHWEKLEERPDLFQHRQTWGDIGIFEVLAAIGERTN